jgi:sugar lactone lactonase YvrE
MWHEARINAPRGLDVQMRATLTLATLIAAALAAGAAPAQTITKLVPGSSFHGVHGIRFAPSGELYAGSVAGQTLYSVNVETGAVRVVEGPPKGMADDIAFGPGGQVVWTAISDNTVYTRRGNGPVEVLAKDLPGANSVAFSRDGKRLFLGQVFAGDAVVELDPAGLKPPRKIAGPVGGFNSFAPGPDGMLYGPLWFKGQIARLNPDTGELTVIAEGIKTPAAAKFDSKNNLYALDTKTGELLRIDIATGAKTRVAQLATSLDNFAISPTDRVFVSNMADNGIQEVDVATGRTRQVVKGALAFPADIAVVTEGGRDVIHVADVFSYRSVDGVTGAVTDIARMHGDNTLEYPTGVSVGAGEALVTSWVAGTVQTFERGKPPQTLHGFAGPSDALRMTDGALLVLEMGSGKLIKISGVSRTTLVSGLAGATGMAWGPDGYIYVAEAGGGQIRRINPVTGEASVAARGLDRPKALAVSPAGRLVVLEMGAGRVVEIDPADGLKSVVAYLPLGLITQPLPIAGGIALGARGDIYVASDVENAIYKISRRP